MFEVSQTQNVYEDDDQQRERRSPRARDGLRKRRGTLLLRLVGWRALHGHRGAVLPRRSRDELSAIGRHTDIRAGAGLGATHLIPRRSDGGSRALTE